MVIEGPTLSVLRKVKNITASKCVRRNLFGPVDHTQNREDLERELKNCYNLQDMRQKWNFDFFNGVGLGGRYEWERAVPSSHQGSTTDISTNDFRACETTPEKACAVIQQLKSNREKPTIRETKKLTAHLITEAFRQRRKTTSNSPHNISALQNTKPTKGRISRKSRLNTGSRQTLIKQYFKAEQDSKL